MEPNQSIELRPVCCPDIPPHQAAPGAKIADEAQRLFIAKEWLGGSVSLNLREKTALGSGSISTRL
jgi:hypothetical protein